MSATRWNAARFIFLRSRGWRFQRKTKARAASFVNERTGQTARNSDEAQRLAHDELLRRKGS